jgi:hypothetical protein
MTPGRITTPKRSGKAKRDLARKLRDVLAALDAGTLTVSGHDGDGADWHEGRLREHLERRVADLEGGGR